MPVKSMGKEIGVLNEKGVSPVPEVVVVLPVRPDSDPAPKSLGS